MPKYKYSGKTGKGHPKGDFRTQEAQLSRTERGPGYVWFRICEDYTGGRWEGFVSYPGGRKVYRTKAEALKHRPKW